MFVELAAGTGAQQPADSTTTHVDARGEEVVVDFVVRDKKGHAVTDLSEADFSVFDNGRPRAIRSFRLVHGASLGIAGGAQEHLDPLHEIRLISLIFDRLDLDGRRLARQASLDLLRQAFPQNLYMAVFTLDQKLSALQAFTNNRELLRKAIERATAGAYSEYGVESAQVQRQLEQFTGANQTGKQDLEERVNAVTDPADHALAELLLSMLRLDQRTDAAQTSRSSLYGLLSVARGQQDFPGRKTVFYFSNGFVLPHSLENLFKTVLGAANNGNVTFYAIDARGLTTESQTREAAAQLASGVASSTSAASLGHGVQLTESGGVSTEAALSTDTALDSGRFDTQNVLGVLAEKTGGGLVANTNDFRGPLHKIFDEVQTYYECSYLPEIEKYDGSFRSITVKTSRADLRVQARTGYFALPPALAKSGLPLDPYEVPLLRALSSPDVPGNFPFESGGLHFRSEGRNQTMSVLIDLPLSAVTISLDKVTGAYNGGLSYLVLVKNQAGEIVNKLHGDVPMQLSGDQLASFHQSRFTDAEYFDVPAGHYTLETAMLDRGSGLISAKKSAIVVPKPTDGLALSSVALIRSWKPKEEAAGEDDPFVYGGKAMTPTLMPNVSKSASNSLPFYLMIYPDSKKPETPELTIEFIRDGKSKRVGSTKVTAAPISGELRYVATAPIEPFEPGNYEIRFTVRQGEAVAQESFALTLEP